jgi:hypothetical protein
MNRKLLRQALYALKEIVGSKMSIRQADAIAALETELAKPEQDHGFDRTASHMAGEYVSTKQENKYFPEQYVQESDKSIHEPVNGYTKSQIHGYTSSPRKEWVGLTDKEIENIVDMNTSDDGGFDIFCDGKSVAQSVIAKLKEKNHD